MKQYPLLEDLLLAKTSRNCAPPASPPNNESVACQVYSKTLWISLTDFINEAMSLKVLFLARPNPCLV